MLDITDIKEVSSNTNGNVVLFKKIEKRPVIEVNTEMLDAGEQLAIVFDKNKAIIAKRAKVQQPSLKTKVLTALSGLLLAAANRNRQEA